MGLRLGLGLRWDGMGILEGVGPKERANNRLLLSCVCRLLNCKVNGQNVKSKPNKRGVTRRQQGAVSVGPGQVADGGQVGLPEGQEKVLRALLIS